MSRLTTKLTTLPIIATLIFFSGTWAMAGSLDSPAAPTDAGSAMFTLEDLYKRLDDGTAGSKRVGAFAEPAGGPTAGTGKTLDEVMGQAPAVVAADGAVAADVLEGKKFWGLLPGTGWGPMTGALVCGDIPCSGDRWSNTAIDPTGRWCDNGDGTVTDLFGNDGKGNGLVWLKNAMWGGLKTWKVALNDDDAHTRAGILSSTMAGKPEDLNDGSMVGDWRLPTLEELKALTNGIHQIRVETPGPFGPFTGHIAETYWSSTTYASDLQSAYFVRMNGYSGYSRKTNTSLYVWPVRARTTTDR